MIKFDINDLSLLDQVIELSKLVFNPTHEEILKYHSLTDWKTGIENGGLLVTAVEDNDIAGFAICYPKEGKFHIWNVGVRPDFQGKGIWKSMFEMICDFAVKNNYSSISLNTNQEKFPNMYAFAIKNGFNEVKCENGKVYFAKMLS